MTKTTTAATAAELPLDAAALAGGALRHGDALVQVRCGAFGLLLPLEAVERVLPAALPAARPAAGGPGHPVVSVGGDLLPVLFGEALLGEPEARLRPEDQLVLLRDGPGRALLWVSAVEDVVPCRPLAPPPGAEGPLVAGWSGEAEPLAVLDVARAVALAQLAGGAGLEDA